MWASNGGADPKRESAFFWVLAGIAVHIPVCLLLLGWYGGKVFVVSVTGSPFPWAWRDRQDQTWQSRAAKRTHTFLQAGGRQIGQTKPQSWQRVWFAERIGPSFQALSCPSLMQQISGKNTGINERKWNNKDELWTLNQSVHCQRTVIQVLQPVECCFCLVFVTVEHDRANLSAASSNSDATYPGLVLILPLAACRPQNRVPSLRVHSVCKNDSPFENTSAAHKEWPLQQQGEAEDVTLGASQTKESRAAHSVQPQNQHGSHMTRNNATVWRARSCLVPTARSAGKSNYTDLTGATNSGLPQKRQSACPWRRKSPLESIAAPKLWGERGEKERDIWNQQLCGPYPRAADSLTPNSPWHRTASLHEKLLRSFSFLHLTYCL